MTNEEKIKQASSAYTAKQGGILSEKVANAFIAGANFGRIFGKIVNEVLKTTIKKATNTKDLSG